MNVAEEAQVTHEALGRLGQMPKEERRALYKSHIREALAQ